MQLGWGPLITILLLFMTVAFIGGVRADVAAQRSLTWSHLVVGEVEDVNCSDKGCSLLVRRADSSTDWVWVPPIEKMKEKK